MKIGLIGDHINDLYVYGTVDRISPEFPIPILKQTHTESRYGGAGNVYNNLVALGAEVEYHSSTNSIKTRYVCNNHLLFRSDQEDYVINEKIDFNIDADIVILSDYNKGYLHNSQEIIRKLKDKEKIVIVDPKKSLENYRYADIVKLNEKEFTEYSNGLTAVDVLNKYNIGSIIITKADKGASIITREWQKDLPAEAHQVNDVTGAGDIFIAVFGFYFASGCSLSRSVKNAIKLASLSVTKFGTYTLTKEDISSLDQIIVFTNGCFDILHKGHIDYLKKSKELGDRLIVGLNSDESIKRIKDPNRPINNQNDRKYVLENLSFVDEVIIFDEDTPYELIKKIRPNIITKGGDYTSKEQIVGNDLATVILMPFTEGYSTTKILEKINAKDY